MNRSRITINMDKELERKLNPSGFDDYQNKRSL